MLSIPRQGQDLASGSFIKEDKVLEGPRSSSQILHDVLTYLGKMDPWINHGKALRTPNQLTNSIGWIGHNWTSQSSVSKLMASQNRVMGNCKIPQQLTIAFYGEISQKATFQHFCSTVTLRLTGGHPTANCKAKCWTNGFVWPWVNLVVLQDWLTV